TLTLATAALLTLRRGDRPPSGMIIRDILTQSALATSIVAAVGLAIVVPSAASATLAAHLFWLALVWLALAGRWASPALFAASQAALSGSVLFAVTTMLEGRDWYVASSRPWLDPR